MPEGIPVTTGRVRVVGEVAVGTVRAHLEYRQEAADLQSPRASAFGLPERRR